MFNFWKLAYKSVKEQRDQHKVELLQCKSELHYYRDELESYKTNLKQRNEERESMISDFQKKLDLVSMLKDENRKLETQKIAFQRSYKQVYEENEKLEQIRDFKDSALKGADIKIKTLERENEELRSRLDEFLEHDYDNQKLYEEMKRENRELKDKIEGLKW